MAVASRDNELDEIAAYTVNKTALRKIYRF